MKNEALYQKYRSRNFAEVVGQEYIVQSIKNAVKEDKIGHAYLFCGPRGTGKTTMARILARAINCENKDDAPCGKCENCRLALEGNHPDIVEINAANETHVEDIRDLIDRARLAPMMGTKKIYIVDEVHQLSSSASSALLKTLEEPPEHVIFILATTDPQKLLKTIISRCQRFDFSKVSTDKIKNHLLMIAKNENYTLEENAALKLAQLADGGMLDALSMLEQASSYGNGNIKEVDIDEIYGLTSTAEKIELLDAILKGDLSSLLERISLYEARGIDIARLTTDLINALKDSVIYANTKKESLLRSISFAQAKNLSEQVSPKDALDMIEELMKAKELYKGTQSPSNIFEVTCMKLLVKEDKPIIARGPQKEKPKEVVEAGKEKPKEEEVKVEEEIPYEETEETMVDETRLTIDYVLGLLVQCDKENKTRDNDRLSALVDGLITDRYIAALKQSKLMASGNDCMILVTPSQASANNINDPTINRQLYEYIYENCDIDKRVFALSEDEYKEAIEAYKKRRAEGNLPSAVVVEKYVRIEEKGEEPDPEEKLQELFGKEGLLEVHD